MSNREAAAASERPLPTLPAGLRDKTGVVWFDTLAMHAYVLADRAASAPQAVRTPLTEEQVEALARTDIAGDLDIDWADPANLGVTAPQRAAFRRGFRAAEHAHSIEPLAPQDDDVALSAPPEVQGLADWLRAHASALPRRLDKSAETLRTWAAGVDALRVQPAASGVEAQWVESLLWDEHPECCGSPVVGAEYMGQQEVVCCGCPEGALLNDAQIVATLRAKFPKRAGQKKGATT
jgi:hypothetical protein